MVAALGCRGLDPLDQQQRRLIGLTTRETISRIREVNRGAKTRATIGKLATEPSKLVKVPAASERLEICKRWDA